MWPSMPSPDSEGCLTDRGCVRTSRLGNPRAAADADHRARVWPEARKCLRKRVMMGTDELACFFVGRAPTIQAMSSKKPSPVRRLSASSSTCPRTDTVGCVTLIGAKRADAGAQLPLMQSICDSLTLENACKFACGVGTGHRRAACAHDGANVQGKEVPRVDQCPDPPRSSDDNLAGTVVQAPQVPRQRETADEASAGERLRGGVSEED